VDHFYSRVWGLRAQATRVGGRSLALQGAVPAQGVSGSGADDWCPGKSNANSAVVDKFPRGQPWEVRVYFSIR